MSRDTALLRPEDSATKDTVGKLSSELLQKDNPDHTAGEQMQEQLKDYESNVHDCVASGKNIYSGDFYVVVITKRERLMPNVIRNYFLHRLSCPSPDYDQTLYKYHRCDENLEFIWVIPSIVAVKDMIKHKHDLDISFYTLLRFVLEFLDGTLEAKAQLLNKEITTLPSIHLRQTATADTVKKEIGHDRREGTRSTS